MILTAGFSTVDTFFFLSGFFLCFTVAKQKENGPIVFIIGVMRRLISVMLRTADEYYTRPYYHAVCYFGGCMTYLIKEDFREARISKVSIQLTLHVKERRVLTQLLSWNAYVPLSKLSFGVYLIHVPFLNILFDASRERMYWSVFDQVTLLFALLVWSFLLSYLAFLVCEAPTAALDKLVCTRLIGGIRSNETTNSGKTQPGKSQSDGGDLRKQDNGQIRLATGKNQPRRRRSISEGTERRRTSSDENEMSRF
ncbi:hypothetical protein MTO96_019769 [Rhipicephalus appendiculatus]